MHTPLPARTIHPSALFWNDDTAEWSFTRTLINSILISATYSLLAVGILSAYCFTYS
jgi:hypothetical protein